MNNWFIFLVLSLAFFFMMVCFIIQRNRFKKCKMKAIATVDAVGMSLGGSDSMTVYQPIFSFEVDGVKYQGNGNVSTNNKFEYQEGDVVYVYYDEKDPTFFVAAAVKPPKLYVFLTGFIATVTLILMIYLIVM